MLIVGGNKTYRTRPKEEHLKTLNPEFHHKQKTQSANWWRWLPENTQPTELGKCNPLIQSLQLTDWSEWGITSQVNPIASDHLWPGSWEIPVHTRTFGNLGSVHDTVHWSYGSILLDAPSRKYMVELRTHFSIFKGIKERLKIQKMPLKTIIEHRIAHPPASNETWFMQVFPGARI